MKSDHVGKVVELVGSSTTRVNICSDMKPASPSVLRYSGASLQITVWTVGSPEVSLRDDVL
jgi:hypothetical protein